MSTNLVSLMKNRMHALYIHNDTNCLISVNEPNTNQPTPRLAIMLSAEQVLWRFRNDEPNDVVETLNSLIKSEPPTSQYKKPLKHQADYVRVLEQYASIDSIN